MHHNLELLCTIMNSHGQAQQNNASGNAILKDLNIARDFESFYTSLLSSPVMTMMTFMMVAMTRGMVIIFHSAHLAAVDVTAVLLAFLLRLVVTLLLGNIFTLFLGMVVASLPRHFNAFFSRKIFTLLAGNILAFLPWHRDTGLLGHSVTNLTRGVGAVLLRHRPAFLLRHRSASLTWVLVTLLPLHVSAFLLLNILTFLLGHSFTLFSRNLAALLFRNLLTLLAGNLKVQSNFHSHHIFDKNTRHPPVF